jgi:dihydropteroate synthase
MLTINCNGKMLNLNSAVIMGIINITPDSFFEGHLDKNESELLLMAEKMIIDGASILDIGGQSTKPGSKRIEADEELKRVIPVIIAIRKSFPETIISIDTYHSKVAAQAIESGADMVNDISAGSLDKEMIPTVGKLKVPYVCMHMQGTPETMQLNPTYSNITLEIIQFFIKKIEACRNAGIKDIIIDPGFGFGKTIEQNFTLLRELQSLEMLDCPVLAGISRKGMIYKTLSTTPENALNGTTVANTMALINGASILRVHDVKEAKEAITIFSAYNKNT